MANVQIKSNAAQVQPQLGQHVRAQSTMAAFEAASKMAGSAGHGLGIALDIENKRREQKEAIRVMNAANQVNLNLGLLKNKIEKDMQGSNGLQAGQYFHKEAERIARDAYMKSGIRYKVGERAFIKAVGGNIVQGDVWANRWQNQQEHSMNMTSVTQLLDNMTKTVADGGDLTENWDMYETLTKAALNYLPPEQMNELLKRSADQAGNILVSDAVSKNDYARGEQILDHLEPYMSAGTRAKLDDVLYRNQEYMEDQALIQAAVDSGLTDPDEIRKFIEQKASENVSVGRDAEGKWSFNPGVSFAGAKKQTIDGVKAISGFFTRNGCDMVVTSVADSAGVHVEGSAHGRGVGVDIASDALARMSPQKRAAFCSALERSFPGVKVLNEYDHPSDNSTGGHLHLDFSGYTGQGQQRSIGMSSMRLDRITSGVMSKQSANLKAEQTEFNGQWGDASNWVYEMYCNGVSYEDCLKAIKDDVKADYKRGQKLKQAADWYYGNKGNGVSSDVISGLKDQLAHHEFTDIYNWLGTCAALGCNAKQLNECTKIFDDYTHGRGIFAFNWKEGGPVYRALMGDVSGTRQGGESQTQADNRAQRQAWEGIKPRLEEWTADFRMSHKREPDMNELIEAGRGIMKKTSIGQYYPRHLGLFYWRSEDLELSESDIARLGARQVLPRGPQWPNQFVLIDDNHQISYKTAEEIEEMLGY